MDSFTKLREIFAFCNYSLNIVEIDFKPHPYKDLSKVLIDEVLIFVNIHQTMKISSFHQKNV